MMLRFLSKFAYNGTLLFSSIFLLSFSARADSFAYTGVLQQYKVTASGAYEITADGASRASFNPYSIVGGGLGASITGKFNLTAGDVIDVYVGQQDSLRGGGGGTFVLVNGSLLPFIVAGAGGGAGLPVYSALYDEGQDVSLTTSGNSSPDDAPSGIGASGGQAIFSLPGGGGGGGGLVAYGRGASVVSNK